MSLRYEFLEPQILPQLKDQLFAIYLKRGFIFDILYFGTWQVSDYKKIHNISGGYKNDPFYSQFSCRIGILAPKLNFILVFDVVALTCYKFVSLCACTFIGQYGRHWSDVTKVLAGRKSSLLHDELTNVLG